MPQLSVKHKNGKDRALTPPQLFLASLASCILAFVVNYCKNVGINTEDMSVDLSYDKLEELKHFVNLKVAIKIPKGDYASREKAILRVAEHCPVHETIRVVDHIETVVEGSKEVSVAMIGELDPGFKNVECDEILTLEEASKYLKIGKKTLYNLCKEGKLPCYKIGREWRFLRCVLMEWLARGVTSEKSC